MIIVATMTLCVNVYHTYYTCRYDCYPSAELLACTTHQCIEEVAGHAIGAAYRILHLRA